jgi:hypothetical protein
MPKLKIKTSFPYYHKGYERKDYVEGQEVETEDEEFVKVAVEEGWAALDGDEAPPTKSKAKKPSEEETK